LGSTRKRTHIQKPDFGSRFMQSNRKSVRNATRGFGRYYERLPCRDVYEIAPDGRYYETDNIWFHVITMNKHPTAFRTTSMRQRASSRSPLVNSCCPVDGVGMSVSDGSQESMDISAGTTSASPLHFRGDTIYAESRYYQAPNRRRVPPRDCHGTYKRPKRATALRS